MSVALDDARVVRVRLDTPEGRALRQALGLEEAVPELVRAYCLGEWKVAEDGQRPVLITTDDEDRMGDVIVPEGAILEHYRKNPVILWAHDYTLPPLGSAQWIKRTDHGILAKPRWASTEFAQQIRLLYDEGHMRAWSIGFIPKAWEDIQSKDTDKPGITGRRYTKWELLEFSAVPVPANPNALSLAIKSGLHVSASLVKQLGLPEREEVDAKTILQVPAGTEPVVGHHEAQTMSHTHPGEREVEDFSALHATCDANVYRERLLETLNAKADQPPTIVQTLILSKEQFPTAEDATQWASEHQFRADKVDETEDSWRLRQRDPSDFDPESLRTITLTEGVKAVVGHLKEGSAKAEITQQALDQVLTELAEVKAELTAVTQRIRALETEQPETVRIRIAVDGETEAHIEPVIRVAGASLTKAELAKVLGEAIDGRIRKLTGIVS